MLKGLYTAVLMILLAAIADCTPKASPVVAPTPVSYQMVPTVSARTTPASVPEEAAWEKVLMEAKKENKVTLYTGFFTGDIGQALSKAFESRYGIKTELVTGSSAFLMERIKTEQSARKHVADIFNTSLTFVLSAKKAGITQEIGYLPVLKDRGAFESFPLVDEEGHLIAMGLSTIGFFINTNEVRPSEEPRSWNDLLEPRWKGKIGFNSPNVATMIPRIQVVLVDKYKVLDKDYVRKLAANVPRIAPTVTDVVSALARGETAVGIMSAHNITPFIKEGAPVKPIAASEGQIAIITPANSAIKGSPHPNAARVFIDWILSQEGQTVYAKAIGMGSMRSDVPDFTPEAGRLKPTRIFLSDLASDIESEKLMSTGVIGEIFGLKR